MNFETLLKEYGTTVGLPALAFDEEGCAKLRFASGIAVNLEMSPSADCMHLYSVLGGLPGEADDGLCRRLLAANAFGAGTRGATLCIDESANEVLLWRRVAEDTMPVWEFASVLKDFACAAGDWRESLSRGNTPEDGDAMRLAVHGVRG